MKTTQIKRILVPTDFSKTGQSAIDHASFMARLFKAEVFLLHSIEIPETIYSIESVSINIRDLKGMEKAFSDQLNKIAADLKKKYAIKVTTICTRGKCYHEILQAVKDHKIDIVIMGTHGASGFDEYFIGSNAHKTIMMCPCPVITVHSNPRKPGFRSIVLPIDDSLHSRQKVDNAIALADRYGSRIHILGLYNSETNLKKFNIKVDSVEKLIKKSGLAFTKKLLKGKNLAIETLKYSKKIKADLIVVLADHESDMPGMFLGAFSKQIINHSRIPVMSIKTAEGSFEPVSLSGASPY